MWKQMADPNDLHLKDPTGTSPQKSRNGALNTGGSMEDLDKNRSQYDTTLKDLFEQPPQRLLQVLLGRQAVATLSVEFASTQKRVPDLVFQMDDGSVSHI
ncbi:MAG: hypothetical protein H7837_04960, partial [Magnetococcus sp. MYC-9]